MKRKKQKRTIKKWVVKCSGPTTAGSVACDKCEVHCDLLIEVRDGKSKMSMKWGG